MNFCSVSSLHQFFDSEVNESKMRMSFRAKSISLFGNYMAGSCLMLNTRSEEEALESMRVEFKAAEADVEVYDFDYGYPDPDNFAYIWCWLFLIRLY